MNKLNAESSKCWTCKHGVCLQEFEKEKLTGMPMEQEGEAEFAESFGQMDMPSPVETTIEHERVKAICFWRPAGVESPPILVGQVTKCNRYDRSI